MEYLILLLLMLNFCSNAWLFMWVLNTNTQKRIDLKIEELHK